MFHLQRSRKTIYAVVLTIALCLVLSSFSLIAHSQSTSSFTLPVTVNTTGNGWDGNIAFDLEIGSGFMGVGGIGNYFVVMNTNGTELDLRESDTSYGPAYSIASDTLMFEGEPQIDDPDSAWPTYVTNFWNLTSNTNEAFPNVLSEHDIQYDPVNNTFLTMQDYVRQVGNNLVLLDKILQVDPNGNILWSWDTYNYIPLSEVSPFNETMTLPNGEVAMDLTHGNTLDWDYNDSVIYLNLRNTNTFYEINQTTGDVVWACGEFGNFTLLGANGQPLPDVTAPNGAILPPSLWYHCHDVKEVAPDVFLMFDNDYENNSNPDDCHSEILEVTLNTTSMTAYVNWSWEAPTSYWTDYGGGALLLPNGDFIGDFGDPTHQLEQNSIDGADQFWGFNDSGAVFVEVNPAGQVMRTWTFPVGCYVYRIETIANLTAGDFSTYSSAPIITPAPILGVTSTAAPVLTPAPEVTPTPAPPLTPTPTSVPIFVLTPTPSISPSLTSVNSINSQTIIASIALAAVAVVVVVLAVIFYMRKRNSNHKINAANKSAALTTMTTQFQFFSRCK